MRHNKRNPYFDQCSDQPYVNEGTPRKLNVNQNINFCCVPFSGMAVVLKQTTIFAVHNNWKQSGRHHYNTCKN